MQKKLIALAIAGLGFTSVAFAQSNVTVYGVADASIDITDDGDTATTSSQRVTKVSSNQSRIGFKGSEDLGNGLKAIFQLETAFNVDGTSAGNLNSRNTFVGLKGDSWGQIIAGQYDTPYKTNRYQYFADHLGDERNLMGVAGSRSFNGRASDSIRYDSPKFGGLTFALQYAAAAELVAPTTTPASSPTKGAYWSLGADYDIMKEWDVRVSYELHKFGSAGTSTQGFNGTATPGIGIQPGEKEKAWKIGTGYKSGPFRVSLEYEKISDDFSVAANTVEHKAWNVGGGYKFGNNEVLLQYTLADDLDGIANSGAKQIAVGVEHTMSKRTMLYAQYVDLTNDSAASYSIRGAGSNTTGRTRAALAGADQSGLQLGIAHSF